jgi:hypothetical protein
MQEPTNHYYVYALIDPRSDLPFYVGKGSGDRAESHLTDERLMYDRRPNERKMNVIAKIRREGLEPRIEYLAENLDSEAAFELEEHYIWLYGRRGIDPNGVLTNLCMRAAPPNHRGKTYRDIYGDRAEEQVEKRRQIQLARGGYGPKKHSDETKRKIAESSKGRTHICSEEAKEKSRATWKKRKEMGVDRSHEYVIISPDGTHHRVSSLKEHKIFCDTHGLSPYTMYYGFLAGRNTPRWGKNKGWSMRDLTAEKMKL